MNKIMKKLIHFLGGVTEEEYNNAQNISLRALEQLNEDNKRLNQSLRALEHAVKDSRSTDRVNFIKTEKPMITLKTDVRLDLYYDSLNMDVVSEEEVLRKARHFIAEKIMNNLCENNLIDFKISNDNCSDEKILTGIIYVREP